jgi:hypothetical protein
MKRTIRITGILLLLGIIAQGSMAASPSHWSCDPHAYQYGMSVYFSLSKDGTAITDYSDYEVAAFYSGECRGVAEIFEQETNVGIKTICYLRMRSNKANGEKLSLQVYRRSTREVFRLEERVSFVSGLLNGSPSSPTPFTMKVIVPGDTNGDGIINTVDATYILKYLVFNTPDDFVEDKADINGGGINTTDATAILKMLVN